MPAHTAYRSRYRARKLAGEIGFTEISPEAQAARDSLEIFGEYLLGKSPAAHHQRWIDALVTRESNSILNEIAGTNLEILAPRGSAKSTWVALFIAWTIGHNPHLPIIYAAYSESVALSRSRIIKRMIESDKYREIFPHILPGKRWADTDWEISKQHAGVLDLDFDYTFYGTGILGSIVSRRSGLIVYDDLIKSSDSILNSEIRERMTQNIAEVLRPTLIPGGREVDIGTRFRADDVHATEFTEDKGWQVICQSAILEDSEGKEHSYWPERFPVEDLQKQRADNPAVFSFQYQNEVVRISDISIDPDWIVRDEVPTEFDQFVIGADLSSGQRETADYTVFLLLGRVQGDNKVYVLDMMRGRWAGNVSKLNAVLELCNRWGLVEKEETEDGKTKWFPGLQTVSLVAESVSYQGSLMGDFKDYIQSKLALYNLVYKKPKVIGDKLDRLRGVSGLFENHSVVFNQMAQLSRLEKELTNFGALDHDDCVDACVYGLRAIASRRLLDSAD